jgi:gas vesicle protein
MKFSQMLATAPQKSVTESPLDFMRGAASATQQKVAQSTVGKAVGDVVNAGKMASMAGNLQKAVQHLLQLMAQSKKMQQQPVAETYTFGQYMEAIHQDQLDEGVWDFVKGAGGAIRDKIKASVDNYAAKPSLLKDLYVAGKTASNNANADRARMAATQVGGQIKQTVVQIKQIIQQMGDNGSQALNTALQNVPPETQKEVKMALGLQS